MNKIYLALILLLTFESATVRGQNIFNIHDVIERAHLQSPASKQIETQKETSYWQYRSFRTTYNPQLVLSGNAPTYSKQYVAVTQPDGSIAYQPINQTNPGINLGLLQPIRLTGGTISANTSLNYFNDVPSSFSQWNGTVMNVRLNQPLFAFNQFKWNKRIQPIIFEESKRSFVEQREYISREVVSRVFLVFK